MIELIYFKCQFEANDPLLTEFLSPSLLQITHCLPECKSVYLCRDSGVLRKRDPTHD